MAKRHTKRDNQWRTISANVTDAFYGKFVHLCEWMDTNPTSVIRQCCEEWVNRCEAEIRKDPEKLSGKMKTARQDSIIDTICAVNNLERPDTEDWTYARAYNWIHHWNTKTGFYK